MNRFLSLFHIRIWQHEIANQGNETVIALNKRAKRAHRRPKGIKLLDAHSILVERTAKIRNLGIESFQYLFAHRYLHSRCGFDGGLFIFALPLPRNRKYHVAANKFSPMI